ncbi:MAG: phospholipase D-like domain-containing protein [Pseudomonadota bacterium]
MTRIAPRPTSTMTTGRVDGSDGTNIPTVTTNDASASTSTGHNTDLPSDTSAALHTVGAERHLPQRDDARTREVLKTFFAPYDEPIKQDLAMIQEVVEARRTDPRQFADGDNPYSIKYAVYNLRSPEVIEALKQAHQSGVDVQVLIEDAQLDPAKDFNTADEQLIAAGFEFSPTHKGLSPQQRKELDLIGIEGAGLMHLKTRIFSRPDPAGGVPIEKVLTGSFNPGDAAPFNNETLHLISDPQLVGRYKAKVQAVLEGREIANEFNDNAAVNVLFTPTSQGPQPADKILELVDKEREAIFMSVFSLRNITSKKSREGLIDKLKKAKARGVEVVIVTDRKQSDGVDASGNKIGWDDPTEDLLKAAGIPVYECTNTAGPYNAMHNKSAIFGLTDMKVVTDCGNWTTAALGSSKKKAVNDESYLFIDSGKLDDNATGRRYLSNFLNLLRTYESQQTDAPGARELVNRFTELPGWPQVKVDFDVMAKTYMGQDVYITGDHEALGTWTEKGPGLKLNTSGGTYPLWSTDTGIELPFGLALEYKVVKRNADSGELEWDGGNNQLLVVDSGDIRGDVDQKSSAQRVHDSFRGR